MTRILYGVQGEGFGHSTRSIEIINHLLQQGHEVKVVSFDKGYFNLREHFAVTQIFGFNFVYRENEVQYLETVFKNLMQAPSTLKSLNLLQGIINDWQPQLVISDFEPLTVTAAKLKKIPLLSVDNEHILTKTKFDYPKNYQSERQVANLVTRLIGWRAKAYVALSFFPCRPLAKNIFVLPPVIRQEVIDVPRQQGDYILVYLNNQFSGLLDILKQTASRFIIYGFDKQGTEANLVFKKFDQHAFLKDLGGARAVIATAGFSLISEALFLGKPYLAVPAQQQFEQILNAYHLAKMGYGEHHDELTLAGLNGFLANMEKYRQNLAGGIPSGNQQVFDKLEELIKLYAK